MAKEYLNITEAAQFLGVSVPTVRNIVRRGKLSYYSEGGRGNIMQFREKDLVSYMDKKKLMSFEEAAAFLNMDLRSFGEMCQRGDVPHQKGLLFRHFDLAKLKATAETRSDVRKNTAVQYR